MATELVDASKLDACCTAEANAIRAKTGSSSQIAYDWANSKGFADAIAAIPTGGGAANGYHVYTGTTPNSDSANISISIDETPIFTLIHFPDVPPQEETAEPYPIKSHLYIYNNIALKNKYADIVYNFKTVMGVYVGPNPNYYSTGITGSFSSGIITIGSTRTAVFPANQPYILLVSY